MNETNTINTLILTGKMKDVTEYLRYLECKYLYLKDLIDDLKACKEGSVLN